MTRKANDAIFFVEKYAIARDATQFENDAQAQDATLFWRRAPSSEYLSPLEFLKMKTLIRVCTHSSEIIHDLWLLDFSIRSKKNSSWTDVLGSLFFHPPPSLNLTPPFWDGQGKPLTYDQSAAATCMWNSTKKGGFKWLFYLFHINALSINLLPFIHICKHSIHSIHKEYVPLQLKTADITPIP